MVLFQNISYYCLSAIATGMTDIVPTFQNISCYCLSCSVCKRRSCNYISKHLMLLFIDMITNYCIDAGIFQNISCYCLSNSPISLKHLSYISKHLMLLFIPTVYSDRSCRCRISKHLMLLFIIADSFFQSIIWHFKTSHVIVYQELD